MRALARAVLGDQPDQQVQRRVRRDLAGQLVDQHDPLGGAVEHDAQVRAHRLHQAACVCVVNAGRSAARIACSSGSITEWVENDSTRSERSRAGIEMAAPE